MNEVEKAEFNQSLKAYLIPSSLFLSCLINSAGIYIIYSGNPAGWPFLAVGFSIMAWAFTSFIRFQNKLRAQGRFKRTQGPSENVDRTAEDVRA